tara:strand:+ start:238 stop:915 length:678 start_codon:yes stop_codon:yes gene_type:complete
MTKTYLESCGLLDELSNFGQEKTLFAPSNKAWANLHNGETQADETRSDLPYCEVGSLFYNDYSLKDVLLIQIVPRALRLEDMECFEEIKTSLSGQNTTTYCPPCNEDNQRNCDEGQPFLVQQAGLGNTADNRPLIKSQERYTNGFVNKIDGYVILPGKELLPTTSPTATDAPSTLARIEEETRSPTDAPIDPPTALPVPDPTLAPIPDPTPERKLFSSKKKFKEE